MIIVPFDVVVQTRWLNLAINRLIYNVRSFTERHWNAFRVTWNPFEVAWSKFLCGEQVNVLSYCKAPIFSFCQIKRFLFFHITFLCLNISMESVLILILTNQNSSVITKNSKNHSPTTLFIHLFTQLYLPFAWTEVFSGLDRLWIDNKLTGHFHYHSPKYNLNKTGMLLNRLMLPSSLDSIII